MSQIRKIATAGGTFAVALGIGFAMQNGDALAGRIGGTDTMVSGGSAGARGLRAAMPSVPAPDRVSVPVAIAASPVAVLPAAPDAAAMARLPDGTPRSPQTDDAKAPAIPFDRISPAFVGSQVVLAGLQTDILAAGSLEVAPPDEPDCGVRFSGEAGPAATVLLTLRSACAPGAAVTIHHRGMMFGTVLSATGTAAFTVPALDTSAVFVADVIGGQGAVVVVTVPDFPMFDRAVLQFEGETGLQLHALEFGAGYSDAGHLWTASAGSAETSALGDGGFITRLGAEGGRIAEVYSYSSGSHARTGTIALSVEAEVTATNCGREVAAQTMQFHPGADPTALYLTMTLPDCDSVGEFLILNEMLADISLTAG